VIYDRRSPGSRAYFNLGDELHQRFCQSEDSKGRHQGSSIPDRVDPLDPLSDVEADSAEKSPILKSAPDDGLERFITDLGASLQAASSPSPIEEPTTPEIVSLDDLLAEEEDRSDHGKADDDWDEGMWNPESDGGKRIN
jgi:hypothetical protein